MLMALGQGLVRRTGPSEATEHRGESLLFFLFAAIEEDFEDCGLESGIVGQNELENLLVGGHFDCRSPKQLLQVVKASTGPSVARPQFIGKPRCILDG
jgi:hypothetical protein